MRYTIFNKVSNKLTHNNERVNHVNSIIFLSNNNFHNIVKCVNIPNRNLKLNRVYNIFICKSVINDIH